LKALEPQIPNPQKNGYSPVTNLSTTFECGPFAFSFDVDTGAMNNLVDLKQNRVWASSSNMLGLFEYQTFTGQDFANYIDTYGYCSPGCPWWFDNVSKMIK
jgi:hypothetical protein